MAGEWIGIDIALDSKPEIQELIDLTGEPVEVVVFRVFKLWGWASLNSDDGTVRTTAARLARIIGGDPEFWKAVETVGWIRFAEDGTAEIPGWGRRFSQSAKTRALHLERAGRARQSAERAPRRSKSAPDECAQAHARSAPERTRGEERTISPPPPPEIDVEADGATLRAAWNAAARAHGGRVAAYGADDLPEATMERLAEPGWLSEALQAIERLPACRFFTAPVTLAQFSGRKNGRRFSRKVLDQEFDQPKRMSAPAGRPGQDERRPAAAAAAEWHRGAAEQARRQQEYLAAKSERSGDDDFESARAAMIKQLREAS